MSVFAAFLQVLVHPGSYFVGRCRPSADAWRIAAIGCSLGGLMWNAWAFVLSTPWVPTDTLVIQAIIMALAAPVVLLMYLLLSALLVRAALGRRHRATLAACLGPNLYGGAALVGLAVPNMALLFGPAWIAVAALQLRVLVASLRDGLSVPELEARRAAAVATSPALALGLAGLVGTVLYFTR